MKSFLRSISLLLCCAVLTGCNMPGFPASAGQATRTPYLDPTLQSLYQTATARVLPPTASETPGETQGETQATQPAQTTSTSLPTHTAIPSNTPVPPTSTALPPASTPIPPTATVPSLRPGMVIEAVDWSGRNLVLDGDWSEWKDAGREYPANTLVFGRGNWTGQDDLAGSFYAGWDAKYLYLAVKVKDDKYAQNAEGEELFKGDMIEVLLDTDLRSDYYVKALSADDYQLGFSAGRNAPGDGDVQAYMWYPSEKKGQKAGVVIAAQGGDGLYRVEAAIPWSVLGVTPQKGMTMGFALSISDCDQEGGTSQDSMVSSADNRSFLNPTTWNTLLLK